MHFRKQVKPSERFRKIRKKYGFTQDEVANAFNINRSTVNRWEDGALEPKERDFMALKWLCSSRDLGAKIAEIREILDE